VVARCVSEVYAVLYVRTVLKAFVVRTQIIGAWKKLCGLSVRSGERNLSDLGDDVREENDRLAERILLKCLPVGAVAVPVFEEDRLGREGEFDALFGKAPVDLQINGLLDIHEPAEIGGRE
jgi:hypothetical protein